MKIQNILFAVTLAVSLAAVENTSVEAMDTDIYLHTQSTATVGAPDVLILLDNSGSMTETVPTAPPYDATIDYCSSSLDSLTGVSGAAAARPANCSSYANRIYYTSGTSGTPTLTSTNAQWFAAIKSNCIAAQSAFTSPGYYSGDYIAYWGATTSKWSMLLNGGGVTDGNMLYVDCYNDNATSSNKKGNQGSNPTADGKAANDGLSPAASGTTPYISSGTLFSYTTKSPLNLYSANYLAYANNSVLGGSSPQPKINIAKQAVINLINSNKTVRFGLEIFNVNSDGSTGSTSSGTVQCLSGYGCGGGRVVFRVDDMSDARRTAMTTVVNNINAETWTPLAEAMYEAYRYYAGIPVMFGNDQYAENPMRDLTAETYTTQTTAITYGTTTTNSSGQTIYVVPSSETYVSPIQFTCQKPNIIIVTDGDPTNDTTANSPITKLINNGTSLSSCSTLGGVSSDCLDVLAGWMHKHDVNNNMSGSKVTTYTIGFGQGISAGGLALLQSTAQLGGGMYQPATDAAALNTALQAYLANIQQETTSFSAPSLAINAFNKQFDNNYIYLSLFLPAGDAAWDGNVKKYRLCTDADITAGKCSALTDILDMNGNKVTDSAGNFLTSPTPQSYWSPSPDGATVTLGGAGANVPAPASPRNMYTYYDSSGVYTGLTAPSPGVPVSTSPSNTFYQAVAANPTLIGLPTTATSTDVQNLVKWILGQDSYNTNSSLTTQQRWTFGDPLHSTVTPATFGKDSSGNPIIKLLVGDNDGVIRMINENTGAEEWSFLPQEMYAMQYLLSQNPTGNHLYGVDAVPSIWIQDINNNGIIEPGNDDHIYMFIGMRRGGRNIYAFDLTPDHTLTGQNDKSTTPPKLMWVIKGGAGNFAQLGQTWSQPQRVRVKFKCPTTGTNVCDDHNSATDDTNSRVVLMFAGGYDPHQDTAIPAGPDTIGNAIYMVDPFTGSLIWWASSNTGATYVLPNMLYSIPSDLRLVDTDGDGMVDRLYVGDTGGQLWRIDLGTQLGASGNVNGGTSGYIFADVGCGSGVLHQGSGSCPAGTAVQSIRKFFYPPDRAPVSDAVYSTSANYDLITIGSGDREDPLDLLTATRVSPSNSSGNEPVHNRLYAFRDYNYATGAPGTVPNPLSEANLYDATANQIGTDTGSVLTTDLNTLSGDKGWYINLKALSSVTLPNGLSTTWIGEKVLAPTEVVQGVLLATTYTPANNATTASACQVTQGTALEYALNALNATPATGVTTSSGERAGGVIVGSGIPSQVVIVFRPDGTSGLIDAGNQGGVPTAAQGVQNNSVKRNYWYEE